MFVVVVSEKGGAQSRLPFHKPELMIGRVKNNDIVLPKGNVSRRHARIVLKEGRFVIVDLKSTSGTYVNGRKITAPVLIKPGDKVYIGDFILGIEEASGSATARWPTIEEGDPGGLFVGDRRVPLVGVSIDVRAHGVAASVTVAQRYHNPETVPVEAVYTFPLAESAAVCGFEIEVGGRKIVGRVEERAAAAEQYDQALAAGHGAYLLDQERPNIFTASVGNLLPEQECVVRLTYVTELEQTGDTIRLMIPTTVSPRYVPPAQARSLSAAELDRLNPPTLVGGVPYGLKLEVELVAASAIASVECPSHPARVSLTGSKVELALMGETVQLDRDFVMTVTLAEPHRPTAVVAREEDGTRTVMLDLFPDLSSLERGPSEVVFVIDRSGSMGGTSIAEARNALLLCLRSLELGDLFNVVGFGSSYSLLFSESVPYSQESLDAATRHVMQVEADMGGTELLGPLAHVLDRPRHSKLPRQLLLLTDGQVSNEAECIELVRRHASTTRVFTFGIGQGVSEFLVRGLARASRGATELIHPNERIEPKVLRQLARATSPGLSAVRVDWGQLEVELVAPSQLPPMFQGDRMTVFARISGGGPCEVTITAEAGGQVLSFPVAVDTEKATTDPTIPVLMARHSIRDLEEGKTQLGPPASAAVREQLVRLGCRYGLVSSATSFVAIEERQDADHRPAERRRVPIALTRGWHARESHGPGGAVPAGGPLGGGWPQMPQMPAPMQAMSFAMAQPAPGPSMAPPVPGSPRAMPRPPAGMPPPPPRPAAPMPPRAMPMAPCRPGAPAPAAPAPARGGRASAAEERMSGGPTDDVVSLSIAQEATGCWSPSPDLARATGVPLERMTDAARELALAPDIATKVVATLVALRALRERHADREIEWRLIARKAERWLATQQVPTPAGVSSLDEWIARVTPGTVLTR